MKIAYISTYKPRECGIATFSTSILENLSGENSENGHEHFVVAMNDPGQHYDYPDIVKFVIREDVLDDYHQAADFLNRHADAVVLQHEFNIFGGNNGVYILPLMSNLTIPSIAVFHTVLKKPSVSQKLILQEISNNVEKVVVISETALDFCSTEYRIPISKLTVIRHGVPEIRLNSDDAKKKLQLNEKKVILTFGLLTRNKGIETIIRALPAVINNHPDIVYLCLGKTHPAVVKSSGEEYREHLMELTHELKVDDYIVFKDKFLTDEELNLYLSAADILITPYLHEEQISSGPLTFAMGAGTALVSTPYWYAKEMLSENRGRLFEFRNHQQLADILDELVEDQDEMKKLKTRAYDFAKQIVWPRIAEKYLDLSKAVSRDYKAKENLEKHRKKFEIPVVSIQHILRLTDDTGIIRYARFGLPDYKSGYSLEDNARALLAVSMAYSYCKNKELIKLMSVYLSFIQFMQDDKGAFKQHLNYDRTFTSGDCSEYAFGNVVWATGYLISNSPGYLFLEAAKSIFEKAARQFENLESPRGIAATIIGIHYFLEIHKTDQGLNEKIAELTGKLITMFEKEKSDNWTWLKSDIRYNDAVIPLALLYASEHSDDDRVRKTAIDSLKFLTQVTVSEGHLSPVGNKGWYTKGGSRAYFGQQPADAMLMVLLYQKAFELTGNRVYYSHLRTCFNWFLGENDLHISLYDPESQGCCDGLEEYGLNRNQGAESTLSFFISQLSTLETNKQFESENFYDVGNQREAQVNSI